MRDKVLFTQGQSIAEMKVTNNMPVNRRGRRGHAEVKHDVTPQRALCVLCGETGF